MAKIGCHVAKISHVLNKPNKNRKTMFDAIEKDTSILNLDAVQIFVSGPRSTIMNPMNYSNISKYCEEHKINLYVHSNYMSVGIFNVTKDNKETHESKTSIKTILDQMTVCDQLGSSGFVIHLSKKTAEQVIETLKILYPLIKKFKTPLLLEQPAKKPDINMTFETSEKINILTKMIIKEIPKLNWGWCIDTCHLWSGGIELDDVKTTKNWFDDLKYPMYIKLFHLNGGSIDIFKSGKDKHIIPFSHEDDIFGDSVYNDNGDREFNIKQIKKESIYVICQFAKKNDIDLICEINRGIFHDVKFAFETIRKLI